MRVLLTGGQGFVGRHLQAELTGTGHEVLAPSSHDMDVRDAAVVSATVGDVRPDAIVHLAAIAHPRAAAADPSSAFAVAVAGTANLIEAIRAHAPAARLLTVSSAEVYGSNQDLPLSEDAAARPESVYGMAKMAAESIALAAAQRHHLGAVVVRPFNHSGPGQTSMFVLPALADRVVSATRANGPPVRVGNLAVRRDFLHVRDVVRAYRLLLELADNRVNGLVFNVASGRSVAISELLDRLIVLAGTETPVVIDPDLVRPGEIPDSRGDASLLTELTGWHPEIGVDQLVADVWADAVSGWTDPDVTGLRTQ